MRYCGPVRRICLLLAALAAPACSRASSQAFFGQFPDQNVLLVTIDTLRADALGCDGGPARTPNIDALATHGVRFTFAHAHTVVTLPSHASILTGTYPFEHGVRDNSGYRLRSGTETLATRLHASRFATAAFVAAAPLDARFGLAPGFDVYDGRFDDSGGAAAFALPERPGGIVVARAASWIQTQDRRWFAWVHLYEPHAPYRPPPPFDTEYASRPYYGEVAAVDRALGPLFDVVRRSPRSTIVVLTGDHGEALGDHDEATHGLFAYESTLHVPLIVATLAGRVGGAGQAGGAGGAGSAGGAGGAGLVSDSPVRHIDLVPTILDMLALPAAAGLPGHSLRTDADRRSAAERPSYFEAMSPTLEYGAAPLDGVVAGRDKYINLPIPELYDLARDSSERNNLAAHSDAATRRRTLEAQLAALSAGAPGAPRQEDSDAAARLRALGYLSPSPTRKTHYTEADDPKRLVGIDRQLHEAVALGEDGHLAEAIEVYKHVLAERPTLTAASRHLAFAYWRLGEAAKAIGTLEQAAASAADDVGLRVQLGTYLLDVGRTKESIALLEQAARPDNDVDALNALGLAYGRAGRSRDALAAFKRSLQLDAGNGSTIENIAAVQLDAGNLDEARAGFERAVQLNPQSSQAHGGLALVLIKQGDRHGAIAEWKRAVAIDPTAFDALYNLGVQLAREGDRAEAKRYLEQFATTAPPGAYARELKNVGALLRQLK
jgi:arylsulfatase A-like enzyme/Tfp pilus assembly protein PilF